MGPRLTRWMTRGDLLLAAMLLVVALGGLVRMATAPAGARVIVSTGDRVLYTAALATSDEGVLDGPLGVTRLKIDEGGVRIVDSPCPLKICMGLGPIRRDGELIACLPNQILVEVVGTQAEKRDYDLLSR